MWGNQYLGCAQKPLEPAEEDIEKMGAAFENFSVKRGGCSVRTARPDSNKTGPDKVLDEKGSHKVELDDGFIREGKTSRGNVKVYKDVTKRISFGRTECESPWLFIWYARPHRRLSHTVSGVVKASMKARCTQ